MLTKLREDNKRFIKKVTEIFEKEESFTKTLALNKATIKDLKTDLDVRQREWDVKNNGTKKEIEKLRGENEILTKQKVTKEIEIMKREEEINKKIEIFLKKEQEARLAVTFFSKKLKDKDDALVNADTEIRDLKNTLLSLGRNVSPSNSNLNQ